MSEVEVGNVRQRLDSAVESIVAACQDTTGDEPSAAPFPSRRQVVAILGDLMDLLLPGALGDQDGAEGECLEERAAKTVRRIFESLSVQIATSIRHGCGTAGQPCAQCGEEGEQQALELLDRIPSLREALGGDIQAAYDRDPAARCLEEVVLSYPGIMAIGTHRLAHELWLLDVEFIPRMMSEYAHSTTGIDIHPGATIGSDFFIDHGTGVVIGETAEIGDNVTIYQGVTLGGYRFRKAPDGTLERGYKRHPTVGDGVTVYAGATILGGDTVVGAGTAVGGSVWLTHSVPPGAVITIQEPDLKYRVGY